MSAHRAHTRRPPPVWLFDLDNTLHDAGSHVFGALHRSMGDYIERELGLARAEADALRRRYYLRYGATLLGLVRHHGVKAAHFLEHTHRLPALEPHLRTHPHDRAALGALAGRRYIVTNAPEAYARRVLAALGLARLFDGVIAVEQMAMFGELRPKPDARMLRRLAARLRVPASRCVLVEDTLVHQKSARALGMKTVWMQRWLRPAAPTSPAAAGVPATAAPAFRLRRKPVYVYARIRSLQQLRTLSP